MGRLEPPADEYVVYRVTIAERFPKSADRFRLLFAMTQEELCCRGPMLPFILRAMEMLRRNQHKAFVVQDHQRPHQKAGPPSITTSDSATGVLPVFLLDDCDHQPYVMWASSIMARPIGGEHHFVMCNRLVVALWNDRQRRWASRMLILGSFRPLLLHGQGIELNDPDRFELLLPTTVLDGLASGRKSEPPCNCGYCVDKQAASTDSTTTTTSTSTPPRLGGDTESTQHIPLYDWMLAALEQHSLCTAKRQSVLAALDILRTTPPSTVHHTITLGSDQDDDDNASNRSGSIGR